MDVKSPVHLKNPRTLAIAVVMFFLIVFEVYTLLIVYSENKERLPGNVGNFEAISDSLKTQDLQEKFSFAVVGDTRATRTFELLCDELEDEPLSFMVILGDFVGAPTRGNHDYFKFECTHKYRFPFPVFLVTGSNDVIWKGNDYDFDNVSVTDLERMYGPRNFSFEYNNCLFVGLCILPPPFPTSESIEFLKAALAERCGKTERVFVFTHMPMVRSAGPAPNSPENMQALIDVIDHHNVDYVISSHYHGYDRTKRNNTVYLVTGGGGAPLDEKETFNGRCHAIVLTLDNESVSEKAILAPNSMSITHSLTRFAIAGLGPYIKRHPALTFVENFFILTALCASMGKLISHGRHAEVVSTGE